MPPPTTKASFIGFTGTPIESGDKNTQAVFGDLASQARHQLAFPALPFALSRAVVIDVYAILQSKEDKATVPIYYEARLAKIDPNFEEVTEDAEESTKESRLEQFLK